MAESYAVIREKKQIDYIRKKAETLPSYAKNFVLQDKFSAGTAKSYCLTIRKYLEGVAGKKDIINLPINTVLETAVTEVPKFYDIGSKNETRRQHLQAVKAFFSYLKESGAAAYNPVEKLTFDIPKRKKEHTAPFTENDAKTLLESVRNMKQSDAYTHREKEYNKHLIKRDEILLRLMIYKGLTINELVALNVDDFHFDAKTLHVSGREKDIELDDQTNELLNSYLQGTGEDDRGYKTVPPNESALFISSAYMQRIKERSLWQAVNKHLAKTFGDENGFSPSKLYIKDSEKSNRTTRITDVEREE